MNNGHFTGGLLGLHALTSLHPGSGTALGTVDLPVQREKHTGWPNAAGSAVKGILRDAVRERVKDGHGGDRKKANADDKFLTAVFGPDTDKAHEHAGAISVTDARLLAFPVRSLKGVFAWATCEAALRRLQRDVAVVGIEFPGDDLGLKPNQIAVAPDSPCLAEKGSVVLEEFQFHVAEGKDPSAAARRIAELMLPEPTKRPEYAFTIADFSKRLVVLHDDDFTHFARHSTEIVARIRLDSETKTVADGALFYQEQLPAETLMYSVVIANTARGGNGYSDPTKVLAELGGHLPPVMQVGGDETTGKGYCSVRLFTAGGQS